MNKENSLRTLPIERPFPPGFRGWVERAKFKWYMRKMKRYRKDSCYSLDDLYDLNHWIIRVLANAIDDFADITVGHPIEMSMNDWLDELRFTAQHLRNVEWCINKEDDVSAQKELEHALDWLKEYLFDLWV